MATDLKAWIPPRLRPVLRGLRRKVSRALDAGFVPRAFRRTSLNIDGSVGIANLLDVPLIAWMNYHQREILGKQCYWLGTRALKNPMDAWVYQEILYEVKPDIVIEIGNKNGGGTLFLASICELMGHGRVLAIDIDHGPFTASHPRIDLLTGDCSGQEVLATVRERCAGQKVLIIHDADHTKSAVLRDLRNYSPLVSPGSYFIVEDSIEGVPGFSGDLNQPVGSFLLQRKDTALQAIEQFLRENHDFAADTSRERYILTANHRGFLRRIDR